VLVINDLLGLTSGYVPRFVKAYADIRRTISDAAMRYRDEVRGGAFPGPEHYFK
jgi:3-methyl-2-oxobutanoate hydroxymethyltransferase